MKFRNSICQGARKAITIRQNAITMPPVAIERFSPSSASNRETTKV